MLDGKGRRLELGDRVSLWHGRTGEVVCSFDDRQYGREFAEADWAHLGRGALIRLDDGDLIHYLEPDEDLQKIAVETSASTAKAS